MFCYKWVSSRVLFVAMTKQDSRQSNLREDFRDQQNIEYNHTRKYNCNNCGQQHAAKSCPAYGKSCNNCHKLGHYAKLCRSTNRQRQRKPIRSLEYEEDQYEHEHGIDTIETTSTSIENKSVASANTNVHEMTKNEHASMTFDDNKTLSFTLGTDAETNILTRKPILVKSSLNVSVLRSYHLVRQN